MTFKELAVGAEFTFDLGNPLLKDKPMVKLAADSYRHYDGRVLAPHKVNAAVTLWPKGAIIKCNMDGWA